jgi:pimeloyl-ACP methyl ester carboxylesterase
LTLERPLIQGEQEPEVVQSLITLRLHQRLGQFAVVGHDTGMRIGYALAADHLDRVDRLAVAEAATPGRVPSPAATVSRRLLRRYWPH